MSGIDGLQGPGERPRLVGERLDGAPEQRPTEGGSGFGDVLLSSLRDVRSLEQDAAEKADALARGEPVEAHEVMIASSKSEVAFNLALEIRNKLIDAWQRVSQSVT